MDKYCFTCFPFCSGVKCQHDSKFFPKAKWKSWRWKMKLNSIYLWQKANFKIFKRKNNIGMWVNITQKHLNDKKVKGKPTKDQLRSTFRESWTSLNIILQIYQTKHNLSSSSSSFIFHGFCFTILCCTSLLHSSNCVSSNRYVFFTSLPFTIPHNLEIKNQSWLQITWISIELKFFFCHIETFSTWFSLGQDRGFFYLYI